MARIPAQYVQEFMINPRLKGPSPIGTKKADILVMKQVITETLSNPAFLQRLANYAMKKGELKLK